MQSQSHRNLVQMLKKNTNSLKLKNHPNIHITILNETHAKQVHDLLNYCYDEFQPLTLAYSKSFPQSKNQDAPFWKKEYLTNGCSVGLFDSENNNKLIGLSLAIDLNYIPSNFQIDIANRNKMFQAISELQNQMFKKIPETCQTILGEKGVVLDIWNVAIHQDFMGKRLLHQMIIANQALALQQGYKYSFCYCTNFKTTKAIEKINYEKISEINAKQFQIQGQKYFQHLDEKQPFVSLWLKPLGIYTLDSII